MAKSLATTILYDNEIAKTTDFQFIADSLLDNLGTLLDNIIGTFTNKVILQGLSVTEYSTVGMNVEVKAGFAYDPDENELILNPGTSSALAIADADSASDRIDIVECSLEESEYDTQQRAFKSPVDSSITYDDVTTKKKYITQFQVVTGTAGSGVAPAVDDGWVKLAEINVGAGVTEITDDDIVNCSADYDGGATDDWTTDTTVTFVRQSYTKLLKNTTVTIPAGSTAAEIQALIDAQPKNLNGYNLTFQFEDGTYTLDSIITFSKFSSGYMIIKGNSSDNTLSATKSVTIICTESTDNTFAISDCGIIVEIDYIRFEQYNSTTTPAMLMFYGDTGVRLYCCSLYSQNVGYGRGVRVSYGTTCRIYYCYIYGWYEAVFNNVGPLTEIGSSNTFSNNTYDLYAGSGLIISSPKRSVAETVEGIVLNNGELDIAAGYNYASDFTISGLTGSLSVGRVYRNGPWLQGQLTYSITGAATENILITLPSGLTGISGMSGEAQFADSSASVNYYGLILYQGLGPYFLIRSIEQGTNKVWGSTYPVTMASGDVMYLDFKVCINNWD